MQPIRFQNTIEHVAHVSGRGYWSGRAVSLTFLPAEAGTGIVFRRVDQPGKPEIPAHVQTRQDAQWRTTLSHAGTHVEMIEHVMAALYAMEIDNCIVESDAPEMPGMDGSSLAFAMALEQSGLRRQTEIAPVVVIDKPVRVGTDDQWIMAVPSQEEGYLVRYELDYGPMSTVPVCSSAYRIERETFTDTIAPARTFMEEHEAVQLQSQGIASHVTYRDLIVFGENGPIDNELRFNDECSRHKVLDAVGDLALCGWRIQGGVIAHRSGHRLNGELAKVLYEMGKSQHCVTSPKMNTHVAKDAA